MSRRLGWFILAMQVLTAAASIIQQRRDVAMMHQTMALVDTLQARLEACREAK